MQSISNAIASALSPLLQSGASTSVGQQSATSVGQQSTTSGHGGGGSPTAIALEMLWDSGIIATSSTW